MKLKKNAILFLRRPYFFCIGDACALHMQTLGTSKDTYAFSKLIQNLLNFREHPDYAEDSLGSSCPQTFLILTNHVKENSKLGVTSGLQVSRLEFLLVNGQLVLPMKS